MEKRKKIMIVIVILILVVIVRSMILKTIGKNEEKVNINVMRGVEIKEPKEYENIWKESMSDIKGMTIWEKYKKGLAMHDGSDSDGDGLTDKEEIEKYKSNPLKVSTSGDLYTDKYKVQNKMNINKKYKYKGKKEYPYNECEEVCLNAKEPTDFNTVVQECTGMSSLGGEKIVAQYHVYNYSGKLTFDLKKLKEKKKINALKFNVYTYDGIKVKKSKYVQQDNKITLKNNLNNKNEYDIYIVEKHFFTDLKIKIGGVSNISDSEDAGKGLVIEIPLLTFFGGPVFIYYEDLGIKNRNKTFSEKILEHFRAYAKEKDTKGKYIKTSGDKITSFYTKLREYLPSFDVTEVHENKLLFRHALLMYYSYEDKLAYEEKLKKEQESIEQAKQAEKKRKFDIKKDTLVFGNFISELGVEGNCAGIANLTAYVFNNLGYEKEGIYSCLIKNKSGKYEVKKYKWNLTNDKENKTLLNKALDDYKSSDFISKNSKNNNEIIFDKLTKGEQEFVNAVGTANMKGNMNFNARYNKTYDCGKNSDMFDYSLIEEMKSKINKNKILIAYLRMNDNTGHAVNIYGYEEDKKDHNVIWFNVYDSNYPLNTVNSKSYQNKKFRIRIEKKKKKTGKGYKFSYEYYPFGKDNDYSATSNDKICKKPFFIIFDEDGYDINPKVKNKGYEHDFEYFYSSFASSTNDYKELCHYKDSYFKKPSIGDKKDEGYNDSLATTSLCLALSGFASTVGLNGDYSNKDINVRHFLNYAGFDDIYTNSNSTKKPTTHSIGVALANKKLFVKEEKKDYTLIALAVRGGGYESEWAGNFCIGMKGQHEGFLKAKNQVLIELNKYIKAHNISGDVKIWITGYSRGAATANLVAGALDDNYKLYMSNVQLDKKNMYIYCFETPQGALKKDIKNEIKYNNIYNIINRNDFVTKVAMTGLGFTRYGINYFLPSIQGDADYNEYKLRHMEEYYNKLLSKSNIVEYTINNKLGYNTVNPQYKKEKDAMEKMYNDLSTNDKLGPHEIDNFKYKYIILDKKLFLRLFNITFNYIKKYKNGIDKKNIDKEKKNIKSELINLLQDDSNDSYHIQSIYLDEFINNITNDLIINRENYVLEYQESIKLLLEYGYDDKSLINVSKEDKKLLFKNICDPKFICTHVVLFAILNIIEENSKDINAIDVTEIFLDWLYIDIRELADDLNIKTLEPSDLKKMANIVFTKLLPKLLLKYTDETISLFYNLDKIISGHYPELCYAWLMSFDKEYPPDKDKKKFSGNGDYRKMIINCPIDVEVYDSENNKVALIVDNKVKKMKKSSIFSEVNSDGEKIVYLPSNAKYTVKLKAQDEGLMNVSIREYSAVEDKNVKLENFKDINLNKGKNYTLLLPEYKVNGINRATSLVVKNKLLDEEGNEIKSSEFFTNDKKIYQKYYVNVKSNDISKGISNGAGMRYRGDFAKVSAIPQKGYKFLGWYYGKKCVSKDKEYRFRVDNNVSLVAYFIEGKDETVESEKKQEKKQGTDISDKGIKKTAEKNKLSSVYIVIFIIIFLIVGAISFVVIKKIQSKKS